MDRLKSITRSGIKWYNAAFSPSKQAIQVSNKEWSVCFRKLEAVTEVASAPNYFITSQPIYYHVYVIMRAKDP